MLLTLIVLRFYFALADDIQRNLVKFVLQRVDGGLKAVNRVGGGFFLEVAVVVEQGESHLFAFVV